MNNTPRPLKQPILNRPQWVRIVFLGILAAIVTVYLESVYEATSVELAATMGFVAFALMGVAVGVSARNETKTSFNRDIIQDRNQLMLYALALLFIFLPTELAFLQNLLGTTSLSGEQWMLGIGFAFALLLVDEVIDEGVLRMAASDIAAERSAELAEAGAAADLAGEMAAEGVADVATGAAEIGAAMAEEAVAEEMGEGED